MVTETNRDFVRRVFVDNSLKRNLTENEEKELRNITNKIEELLKERSSWLDNKMRELAKFEVGDEIYSLSTGVKLGYVTHMYRRTNNTYTDNRLSAIGYEFKKSPNDCVIYNTGNLQLGYKGYGTKEEVLKLGLSPKTI